MTPVEKKQYQELIDEFRQSVIVQKNYISLRFGFNRTDSEILLKELQRIVDKFVAQLEEYSKHLV